MIPPESEVADEYTERILAELCEPTTEDAE